MFTGAGGGPLPKGLGSRAIAMSWWAFCFVFVATYGANLGANMTIARMTQRRESWWYIQKHRRMDWGGLNDSVPWHHFRKMTDVETWLFR